MKFLDVLDNIILAIVSISGIYGIADHDNEMHDLEEDKYLPKKKINELNIFHSLLHRRGLDHIGCRMWLSFFSLHILAA